MKQKTPLRSLFEVPSKLKTGTVNKCDLLKKTTRMSKNETKNTPSKPLRSQEQEQEQEQEQRTGTKNRNRKKDRTENKHCQKVARKTRKKNCEKNNFFRLFFLMTIFYQS